MDDFGTISSIESLPLPDGRHVKDFDAAQAAARKAARAAQKVATTVPPPQAEAIAAAPISTVEPDTGVHAQALNSNASGSLFLVPATAVSPEYVDSVEPGKPMERKVEPLSPADLSKPGTTMKHLHQMSVGELKVLDALSNEGRQIIRTRLMVIWEEMSVRFERGESVNGIPGTGGKGMGKYLRSIGVRPAKRRSWKFEIAREETLRLAHENPPSKRTPKKKEIVINNETEADLIAKAGVEIAQLLAGDGMTPPRERVNKAGTMAKEILDAIQDGRYEALEPLPHSGNAPVPQSATYGDWEIHRLPAPDFKVKYFEQASKNFGDRYRCALQGSAFTKILAMLKSKPPQALSNASDFGNLAIVLRGAADNLNLLANVIATALNSTPTPPPPSPAPPSTPPTVSAPSKLEQAEEWLQRYLKNGPMPIPDSHIKSGLCRYNYAPDQLPPKGIGKKTIDRAILNLGVQRLPSGPRGGIRWQLPSRQDETSELEVEIKRPPQSEGVKED